MFPWVKKNQIDSSSSISHFKNANYRPGKLFQSLSISPKIPKLFARSTDPAQGGPTDDCIGINYKPAMNVVRNFYESRFPILPRPPYGPVCACTV